MTTFQNNMEPDWDKCIVCQQKTVEPLKCPLQGPGTIENKTDAYRSFLANVEQFQAIGALPTNVYFENESAASFTAHSASWHKSCHLKCNNSKLAKQCKENLPLMNSNLKEEKVNDGQLIWMFACFVKNKMMKVIFIRY